MAVAGVAALGVDALPVHTDAGLLRALVHVDALSADVVVKSISLL